MCFQGCRFENWEGECKLSDLSFCPNKDEDEETE